MLADPTTWGSRLVAAFARGDVTAAELWDLLLAHVDDPRAEQLIDDLLVRFRGLVAGRTSVTIVDEDIFVVAVDDRELLAG
ncbi:MAG TPA: hypothetical protein VEL07_00215 [Planctomycetota bacterium]|nr:hypothetical protein [Planctomycetota bacterium]